MNYLRIILFLLLVNFFVPVPVQGDGNPQIKEQVDWESILSRHDLVWEKTPDDYFNAPFLGNGLLGAMLYAPKGEKLRLDIGRTDVVEHRQTNANSIVDNGRLPVGYFTLEMNDFLKTASGRLYLYNAEAGFEFLTQNTEKNDELIASVPDKWQYNSAGISRCTGPAMEESILTWPSPESPERLNLTYLCYYLWEYYRTTMDEAYLRNHLFPLLKRSVNLMLHEITAD